MSTGTIANIPHPSLAAANEAAWWTEVQRVLDAVRVEGYRDGYHDGREWTGGAMATLREVHKRIGGLIPAYSGEGVVAPAPTAGALEESS